MSQRDVKEIVVGPFEKIELVNGDGEKVEVDALVDTGARRSSVDGSLAKELGIYDKAKVLYMGSVSSALGKQKRPVIELTYYLMGRKITSKVNVANRSKRNTKFLVGRRDLVGFLVRVSKSDDSKQKI